MADDTGVDAPQPRAAGPCPAVRRHDDEVGIDLARTRADAPDHVTAKDGVCGGHGSPTRELIGDIAHVAFLVLQLARGPCGLIATVGELLHLVHQHHVDSGVTRACDAARVTYRLLGERRAIEWNEQLREHGSLRIMKVEKSAAPIIVGVPRAETLPAPRKSPVVLNWVR